MGSIAGRIEKIGPVISVRIMATSLRVEALKSRNEPIPQPAQVRSVIDTGASCSLVDIHLLRNLGLQPTGAVPVCTASGEEERDAYDVSFVLVGDDGEDPRQFTVSAIATEIARTGIFALIGWDVLDSCSLVCRGPAGKFTIRF